MIRGKIGPFGGINQHSFSAIHLAMLCALKTLESYTKWVSSSKSFSNRFGSFIPLRHLLHKRSAMIKGKVRLFYYSHIVLYCRMLKSTFNQLKVGGLLSFNSFLSTHFDSSVLNTSDRPQYDGPLVVTVRFKIRVISFIYTVPFITFNNDSYSNSENEILFSMHSVFRIKKIEQARNKIPEIHLTLVNDDDLELGRLNQWLREKVKGVTNLHKLAQLAIGVKEFEKAK